MSNSFIQGCRGCESTKGELILDLGYQPWCNNFLALDEANEEVFYPLRLVYCNDCGLLQLDFTVDKKTMFSEHTYVSGTTKTLTKHFYDIAQENIKQFNLKQTDLIVDIDGNDGTQLLQYKKLGIENVLNVESAKNIASIAKKNGISTINKFFNEDIIKDIKPNSVKLVNAAGVFFHLEELHSVIKGITKTLAKDGVLVIQFMYVLDMIKKLSFDMIYHEHLLYYTLQSIEKLLALHGLEVFDAYHSDIHNGSVIAKVSHKGEFNKTDRYRNTLKEEKNFLGKDEKKAYKEFAETIRANRFKLRDTLRHFRSYGRTVGAIGAPAKGTTLLNYFQIDNTLVDKAYEVNKLKVDRVIPGARIPIVKEDFKDPPDYLLVLAYNFFGEIVKKNKKLFKKSVQFILPFPEVKVINQDNYKEYI